MTYSLLFLRAPGNMCVAKVLWGKTGGGGLAFMAYAPTGKEAAYARVGRGCMLKPTTRPDRVYFIRK